MRHKPTANPFLQLVHEAGLSRAELPHLTSLGRNTVQRLLTNPERVSKYARTQFAAYFRRRVRVRYELED
jgi:hypothetical protein